jgi:hypothetical protein
MINFSRLLKVRETARDVKKHDNKRADEVPKHLIRYGQNISSGTRMSKPPW